MKPFSRAAAALLVATAVVVGSPAGSSAEAKLVPTLTIDVRDPDIPVRVPLPTEDPDYAVIGYTVHVAGGPATNVTVTVTGTGLATPAPKNFGTVATEALGSSAITATTGGFHQLTYTVTADGAAPAAVTLNYVWAPTGAMTVSPVADLQHSYFGTVGTYSDTGQSYDDRALLLFLTKDIAYYGVPDAGLPKCTTGSVTATTGCLAYAYDPASHLIQVGGAIGRVNEYGVHTIGLGIPDPQGGGDFAFRDWLDRLSFPNSHNRYQGTWTWSDSWFCRGPGGCSAFRTLTLHKNGTFVLADDWRGKKRVIKGRYAVSHSGRMVLTGKFGKETHTFAVRTSKAGKPRPKLGIAFTFGKRKHTVVYFLEPKKK